MTNGLAYFIGGLIIKKKRLAKFVIFRNAALVIVILSSAFVPRVILLKKTRLGIVDILQNATFAIVILSSDFVLRVILLMVIQHNVIWHSVMKK